MVSLSLLPYPSANIKAGYLVASNPIEALPSKLEESIVRAQGVGLSFLGFLCFVSLVVQLIKTVKR